MNHASLFSGIGGPDLAAEWMGWKNVFHCEINPFGQKILKYYWPNSISYENIITTDFTIHRGGVDVLTGGFPCQPYSVAGLRRGKEDARHLWPEMLRAIREIKPRWVVGENVLGLVGWNDGLVFEEVQADLEAEGYEVQPYVLPAAGADAPHKRYRVWFVAYRRDSGSESLHEQKASSNGFKSTTNPSGKRYKGWTNSEWKKQNQTEWANLQRKFTGLGEEWTVADSNNKGIQGRPTSGHIEEVREITKQYTRGFNKQPDWKVFPTQSPICDGDDGFSSGALRQRLREDSLGCLSEKEINKIFSTAFTEWRTESIKAGGNAIVPQVILQIFKSIEAYENLINKE